MRVFTRAVCLEEGYNIVAAHSQKPIPPTSEPLQSNCSQFAVNSTVISRTPQEPAGKELNYKSMLNNVIAS